MAPGPPDTSAVAHPAMFPVPTCAAIAVASAWKVPRGLKLSYLYKAGPNREINSRTYQQKQQYAVPEHITNLRNCLIQCIHFLFSLSIRRMV